jgi:Raf kinase inhibitor-like YbhB/YbcL family protein
VAPKPAAHGFLVPKAKTASARLILALAAAAALALGGCGGGGGGSDSSSATGSASSTSADAPPAKNQGAPNSSSASPGQGSQGARPAGNSGDPSQPSSSQGPSEKHGPKIKLPKGEPEPAPTAAEKEQATIADIALASPDLQSAPGAAATLTAANTCDGKNESPSLIWQGVPPGTQELALYVVNAQPVEGRLFVDWAVTGLDPSLTSLQTNRLPAGAIQGQNDFGRAGFEICPPGGPETYVFTLYALPKRLGVSKGFDPHQLREEILAQSGNAGLMAAGYGG